MGVVHSKLSVHVHVGGVVLTVLFVIESTKQAGGSLGPGPWWLACVFAAAAVY